MLNREKEYDVVIVGGGIVGTALFYALSKYSNVEKIALFEKYESLAMVSSHNDNNSQTLHFGDIETNYTLEKARRVKEAADMVVSYLEKYGRGMFSKGYKMVLGVGSEEIRELEKRHTEFASLFPNLKKMYRAEIGELEPCLVDGRSAKEEIMALYTEDGYAVNFKMLAESFARKALENAAGEKEIFMGMEIVELKKDDGYYILTAKNGRQVKARVVVFATGPYSLVFARKLGYGKELGILPVAGNFYSAENVLGGKVYMTQIKKMPFAAIHGDPDVVNPRKTRFGPTIRVLPLLERHNYRTILGFLKTSVFTPDGILSLLKITLDKTILKYIIKNIIYDIPFLGKRFFLRSEIRKIVPALSAGDISLERGKGGIRPQVVDTKTREMKMGEAEIIGDNIIFNITPSPGASVCLKNAEQDALKIISMLGWPHRFYQKEWCGDFGSTMIECRE